MKLTAFGGDCPQLQLGQKLKNSLDLKDEYKGFKVNEFCFQDGFDGTIKISVDLTGFINHDEIWDFVFRKELPLEFSDFFSEETRNDYFYAKLEI